MDLLSSLAQLVGSDLRSKDSAELLNTFIGTSDQGRTNLIIEATTRTALRHKNWVMIPPYEGEAIIESVNIEIGNSNSYQLYDLSTDKGQQKNLAETNPKKLQELIRIFENKRGSDYSNIELIELK